MNGVLGDNFLEQSNGLDKVVWGLADMNPFTGVCHYSGRCDGYVRGCSSCPALRDAFSHLAHANISRKKRILEKFAPEFVAPTDWMYKKATRAYLLKNRPVHKILNPLSSKFFEANGKNATTDPNVLRATIIAANLDDKTKGVWTIVSELRKLLESRKIRLSLAGLAGTKLRKALEGADFYGQVSNQQVLSVLSETDVLLVPSLFENAGTVVAEAASQGVPSIARRVGGMPEMTNYGKTGYLFDEPEDLLSIFDSLTKKDLKRVGRLAKDWSQNLRPEIICAEYANQFLKSNR
jgi:glycosyltransferase involved in cell wall biosynthesis